MNHSTAPTSTLYLTEDILVATNEYTITMVFLLMIGHQATGDAMDNTAFNGPKSAGAFTRSGTDGDNCPMSSLSSSCTATLGSHVPPVMCSLAPHSINDGSIRLIPPCITPAFN
ncbi:hypothetical protein PAXRUDRAFT_33328 [Paxillus rubicundulus Ve08.2h10]|uniref:Uncharacterized protein n=1 Tax=Paxillus rubicundulus Ve08.2h10 TaxID=930991 RepID=A0A0D0DXI3_9AGAM|nr:hypothetical protein PAXRUDRAFT_33328 [Paxillus rubicundulus Ve08.2h10]